MTPEVRGRIVTLLKWVLLAGVLAGPGLVYVFDLVEEPSDRLGLAVIGFYVLVVAVMFGAWIKRRWW